MEKQPDEPEDVTNEPLPSMSEPMEVQDAIASTSATPFAQPIIAASKSKAQKQREYRQRIAASRTPAQAAAARESKNERQRNNRLRQAANLAIAISATPFAEPITAAPKTRAQIQREYRQRIAASKTPAQAAAAREARNVRDRNNRLCQGANLAIASGSLEAKTTSSSRSGQRLNTVHIDTQRQFTDQQRQTLATEPEETTVQPSTSSDQIEVQAQSPIMRFKSTFLDNDFGYACSVCDRLRFRNDLKPITAAQLKVGDASGSLTTLQPDGSDRTIHLPEAKEIIASVYRYLQTEYENLKDYIGSNCDLSPLANILKRTADATGVSEQIVTVVLGKGKRSQESTHDTVQQKRAKLSNYYEDDDLSPIEEEYSCEDVAEGHNADDDGHKEHESDPLETLKVEFKEEVDEDHISALKERMRVEMEAISCETTSAVQHLLSTTRADVKIEPVNTEYQQTTSDVHQLLPSEHVEIKQEPSDIEYRRSTSAVHHIPPDATHNPVKTEPCDGD